MDYIGAGRSSFRCAHNCIPVTFNATVNRVTTFDNLLSSCQFSGVISKKMSTTVDDVMIDYKQTDDAKPNRELDENFRSDQYNLLKSIAIRDGFDDYDIEQILIPNKGGNFLGILYEATIRGKRFKVPEELRLFVKIAASSEGIRQVIPMHDVYCNEFFVYKALSRLYNNLQTDVCIPEMERFVFPKFFGSLENDYAETIVLDNLTHKGYIVQNRFEPITLEYAKFAINNLAKFHALSYILEKRDPGLYEEVIKMKINILNDPTTKERRQEIGPIMTKNALALVENPKYVDKVRSFCESMFNDITQYFRYNKHPVLCHGDYRVNNILVKYEKDRITSMVPVDYQLIYYGSPVNDLFYFIFSATDQHLRRDHFDNLVKHYYESLSDFLKAFSYDVEDIYPKNDFDSDIDSHRMYGLVMAVHILQFMLVSENDGPNASTLGEDKDFYENMGKSANDVFKQRFNGIVEDFVRWGYL